MTFFDPFGIWGILPYSFNLVVSNFTGVLSILSTFFICVALAEAEHNAGIGVSNMFNRRKKLILTMTMIIFTVFQVIAATNAVWFYLPKQNLHHHPLQNKKSLSPIQEGLKAIYFSTGFPIIFPHSVQEPS